MTFQVVPWLLWVIVADQCVASVVVVVGDGQNPSTCNYSALVNGIAQVYASPDPIKTVRFNCKSNVTIHLEDQILLSWSIAIDGNNQVTLDGDGYYRQFRIGIINLNYWDLSSWNQSCTPSRT